MGHRYGRAYAVQVGKWDDEVETPWYVTGAIEGDWFEVEFATWQEAWNHAKGLVGWK